MDTQQLIINIILGIMLFLCGIKDLICRHISIYLVAVACTIIIILIPFGYTISYGSMLGGFLIGVLLLVLSRISNGQIGMGDGFVFCATGLGLGFWPNLCLLIYSLGTAAIFSGFLLIFRSKNRRQTIPFVPFVCFGYIGVLLL